MPTVNIYSRRKAFDDALIRSLKKKLIEQLSCKEIRLQANEISIRTIETNDAYMIAEIECEIKAHNFPERVVRQDDICNEVRKFLLDELPQCRDARVWLILSEL